MAYFTTAVLYTGADGRARFSDAQLVLDEGTPQAMLSKLQPSSGFQFRESPVGFRSAVHCTPIPQFVFILSGEMEIGLPDGSSRVFRPGQSFYSADVLPQDATFDAQVHGHWSAQRGPQPLATLFLRADLSGLVAPPAGIEPTSSA